MFESIFAMQPILLGIDFGDLIGVIIFIIVAVASWISQVMQQKKKAEQVMQQKEKVLQQAQRQGQKGRPQQNIPNRPPPKQEPGPLVSEIEDFLRRVADKKPAPAPKPARPIPHQQKRTQPQQLRRPSAKPVARPNPASVRPPKPIKLPSQKPPASSSAFPQLPSEAKKPTTKPIPAKVKSTKTRSTGKPKRAKKPDRQLGQLDHKEDFSNGTNEQDQEMPTTAAAGFAAILADTDEVRKAIVLNEILTRPARFSSNFREY
jgi:hypothetical protein